MKCFKLFILLAAVLLVLFSVGQVVAKSGKVPEINTRGACLSVKEFAMLIQQETKRLKSGDNLRLIVDIPNETQARQAIAETGLTVVEETRDKGRDFLNFLLEVKK